MLIVADASSVANFKRLVIPSKMWARVLRAGSSVIPFFFRGSTRDTSGVTSKATTNETVNVHRKRPWEIYDVRLDNKFPVTSDSGTPDSEFVRGLKRERHGSQSIKTSTSKSA